MPIMGSSFGEQLSLKRMCCLKALVGILLQTQEIPHKHARMLNGDMAIISCSQLIAKHFSKKESPLLALQANKVLVTQVLVVMFAQF